MDALAGRPVEPRWLTGSKGNLFGCYFPADGAPKGAWLYLPPFAEEMNRCRNMAALQARHLAALGYAALILDPYGTGDSEGLFHEATLAQWVDDALMAADWLQGETGQLPGLWGMRLGALLSLATAAARPGHFQRALLWQPVTDGKSHITQFLRIRMTNLADWNRPAETTKTMRADLEDGKHVEVTGYVLGPQLALPLDALSFASVAAAAPGLRIDWLERHSPTPEAPDATVESALGPAASKAVAALRAHSDVRVHGFDGPSFWTTFNREWAPELLERTNAAVISP